MNVSSLEIAGFEAVFSAKPFDPEPAVPPILKSPPPLVLLPREGSPLNKFGELLVSPDFMSARPAKIPPPELDSSSFFLYREK